MKSSLNPTPHIPDWTPPPKLMQLDEPRHQVLAEFVHGCSPDPATRTAATTALVLSMWQLKGGLLTREVPSTLLLQAGESDIDPIDDLIRDLVFDETENQAKVQTEGAFMHQPISSAPTAMKNAFKKRHAIGDIAPNGSDLHFEAQNAEDLFHGAKTACFGKGRCRPYSNAWHPDYGLLTSENDEIILRLNDTKDREAFLKDLEEYKKHLAFPTGIGRHLLQVPKTTSLSGSISQEFMNRSGKEITIRYMMAMGRPVFLLPYPPPSSFEIKNLPSLETHAYLWRNTPGSQIPPSAHPPPGDWIASYRRSLRARLFLLPPHYDFAIQQATRQLEGVCTRLVLPTRNTRATPEEISAIRWDLYCHTLRGIVLSVAGLSWFGHGIQLGPECVHLRDKARNLLNKLRQDGPISVSNVLRKLHLKKHERDALLPDLVKEHLIRIEDKNVIATTYPEFVKELYQREEFPPVEEAWPVFQEKIKASKAGTP